MILATDGTAVEITVGQDGGFVVDPGVLSALAWADQARRLLAEHA